jgi:peptidoglycan/xylan/chitin deacetylase (PgdA/CDA1 family)
MRANCGVVGLILTAVLLGGYHSAGAEVATPAAVAPAAIPVVCYHRFGHYPENDPYFVTPEEFRRQLSLIREEGYTPILASELEAGLAGQKPLPAKPILITVDDGYNDAIRQALPVLKEFGYKATLFVYPGFIGSRFALTVAQLQQLRTEGWEIGSHSYTHPKLTKPLPGETAEKYSQRLHRELAGSRQQLQEWLGVPVDTLAYPYGLWNQTVADAARAAGYRLMFTVDQGTNTAATPPEQLKRIMVLHQTSERTFRYLLQDLPLPLSGRTPAPGLAATQALTRITATLAPGILAGLDPHSFQAAWGGERLAVTLEPESGRLLLDLPKPWTRGTNSVMLTARDAQHQRHYKECWLVTVIGGSPRVDGQR